MKNYYFWILIIYALPCIAKEFSDPPKNSLPSEVHQTQPNFVNWSFARPSHMDLFKFLTSAHSSPPIKEPSYKYEQTLKLRVRFIESLHMAAPGQEISLQVSITNPTNSNIIFFGLLTLPK